MMQNTGPGKEREQAFLIPHLLVMTVVTGAVDAVSILRLGHIFVANMTGNIVFLGFALARASGFSVTSSLVALTAFLGGAAVGARTLRAQGKVLTFRRGVSAQTILVAAAAVIAFAANGSAAQYTMTVLLGASMGIQNAIVRSLGVPDLTTTVLTLTLTGLASDPPGAISANSPTTRRAGAIVAMLVGAAGGALLVLHASTGIALAAATAALSVVVATTSSWQPATP